jgi:nitroreductase
MNPVLQAIAKRRSVRSYAPKPVPRDVIAKIIDAANQAPSAMNSQPWRFVIVEDASFHKKLTLAAIPESKKALESLKDINPDRYHSILRRYDELEDPIYYSAPVIIFVIGSGSFSVQSCSLACQNIMLAAYSMGLGSCWVHFGSLVTHDTEIKDTLAISDHEQIFGPIIIGYPQNIPDAPGKKTAVIQWI